MPWRPMLAQDLAAVQVLADTIHVDHPENAEVFAERLRLHPQGCMVLEEQGRLLGYAIAHPWHFGSPPALNSALCDIPPRATTYYIHDVALLTEARSKGHASHVSDVFVRQARDGGFSNLSLVAVNNSRRSWERSGFRGINAPGLEEKLRTYGPDAVLMTRDLAGSLG